ncbi:MAG: response regulator, partial [Rhodospirillaceae bacterium]|nr:response regulator [Rhodospirillaceae bacterium]
DMLQRSLGETVSIETVTAGNLWNCEVDPVQIENVLLNLAINARDAMHGGGLLTIEAANARLDEAYAAGEEELEAGQYVVLTVSDNGSGMAAEVAAQGFEPYFTTKDVGEGSGLGLSMVYGFVKQSGGHVAIYSELGEGTSVKVYLPRAEAGSKEPERFPEADEEPMGNGELVLVVEDNPGVRKVVVTMLGLLNYGVIEAADAQAALDLSSGPEVDILLSDAVLPGGFGGHDLAREFVARNPGVKVVFMSGYTENAVVHQGRLDEDIILLQKPFTQGQLARQLKVALTRTQNPIL